METLIRNRAGQMFSNKVGERDVTVKLTDKHHVVSYCNGFITEVGSLVYGCTLDPEPEFELEYSRPEVILTLLNCTGGDVISLEAWKAGGTTMFRQDYSTPRKFISGETTSITGPAY